MAEEKNDQIAEEIQENPVSEETVGETAPAISKEKKKAKTGGFGLTVFVSFVVVIGGLLAGIPQTRNMILEKYRSLSFSFQSENKAENTEKETASDAEAVKAESVADAEEMEARLEQLENAREFENAAEIIATVEAPEVPVKADPAYTALADRQKALLAEIERLRSQVQQMSTDNQKQMEQLKEEIPNTQRIEEQISAVHIRDDIMEEQLLQERMKIDRLEKNKADASSVLSLMTRMDAAEQKIRISNAEKERAVALLLSVYQLREAAFSGNGFATEQQSALALADFSPRIAGYIRSLSNVADQGIRTKSSLLRSFNFYADQAVLSETISPKEDWFHQALNSLKKLIVIRRIDAPEGDNISTQSVLARAGLAVRDDDLSEAVLVLKDLQGKAADAMSEWIQSTERYLAVRRTINETISAVLGVVYAEQLKGE